MYGAVFPLFNVTKPPFDDVRARYALNMATNKRAIAEFAGAGRSAALSLIPPAAGYDAPASLPDPIEGREYDVLAYNPEAARELFVKATGRRENVRVEYLFPNLPDTGPRAEILQQEWRQNLGIELVLIRQELQTWLQSVFSKSYSGVADWGDSGGYVDPAWFLDTFTSSSTANGTGWADPRYDAMLARAAGIEDPAERMARLSECERYLLRGMPFLPLYRDVWAYLRKPFVKGIGSNAVDRQQFKYAWIDRNWRRS
jgi:oligopeptide transport system substrate-binding protein